MEELLDYVWHDTQLLGIEIDRTQSGHDDTVRLRVEWSQRGPRPEMPFAIVDFKDCYWLEMNMNFGVIPIEPVETIDQLSFEPNHPQLGEIARFFGVTDLSCVVLQTNSSGSTIRIIARSVSITPLSSPNGVA